MGAIATVSSTLQLFDAMSGPLRGMVESINLTISAMRTMQQTTNQAADMSGFTASSARLADVGAELKSMGDAMDRLREPPLPPPLPPPPPEWMTRPLPDIFHTTGIDRFTDEIGTVHTAMEQLQTSQRQIAEADTKFLPANAQADITALSGRIDQMVGRFRAAIAEKEELARQLPSGALGPINDEIEQARQQLIAVKEQQDALNDAMRRGDLSEVHAAYDHLNRQVDQVDRHIRDNTQEQEKFNSSAQRGEGAMHGLLKTIGGFAAGYVSFRSITGFLQESFQAANDQIHAEQRLQTIMGNINGMTQDGIELVKQRAHELEATTAISADAGIVGQSQLAEYVYDPTNIAGMTEAMYNLATETYGANVSADQLQQTANLMGKVMMGDINALSRNGFKIDAIFTEAEQKLLKTGTEAERAAMVIEMIDENLGGLAESMRQTPEGAILALTNAWGSVQEKIGYGVMPLIMQFADYITANMPTIEAIFLNVFGSILAVAQMLLGYAMNIATFIVENWPMIEPILWGVAAAMTAWWIITQRQAIMQGMLAVKTGIASAATFAQKVVTLGLAAAWGTLNAAMKANVFILIISVVVGLMVWLWKLWQTNDEFAAALFRIWFGIENFFSKIPAFFWELVEWLMTPFEWWAKTVGKIYDVVINGIITGINKVLEIVNKVTGSSYEISGTFSFENIAAGMKEFAQIKKEDAYARATEKAAEREQWVQDFLDNRAAKRAEEEEKKEDRFAQPELHGLLESGEWNIDNVNTVGKIKDTVDISSEDLKVMRDLAEIQAIQNFVELAPTVQVTTGPIYREVDVDTMIREIEEAMEREIAAGARGEYGV